MANFGDIYSPEALRSLEGDYLSSNSLFIESRQEVNREHIRGFHETASTAPESQHRAASSRHSPIPGFSTFLVTNDQGPRHKRAKFDDPERRKVAQVRKEGACIRCRLNKIPCSSTRPCMSCVSCWLSFDARSFRLRWMGCVPFSWEKVNIYALDLAHDNHDPGLEFGSLLVEERMELCFKKVVHWDINNLSTDFARWMAIDEVNPAAKSRVGILSSVECERLLHRYLDKDLCLNFRILIKLSSLLFNRKDVTHPHYGREQLSLIRSCVGVRVLKNLEAALKGSALAEASKEKLMGLFLVFLGSIIAITYTSSNFEEARHELLRILAHHMVFVGERIGLLECDSTKQRLTETCHSLWNKPGSFEWNYRTSSELDGLDMPNSRLDANSLGHSPTPGITTDSPPAPVSGQDSHHPCIQSYSAPPYGSLLQSDPICTLQSDSIPDLRTPYDSIEGIEHGSPPISMEMTTCFLCNGRVAADQLCPACFGPVPSMLTTAPASRDTASQSIFDSFSPVTDIGASVPKTASREAAPFGRENEARRSDELAGNDLLGSKLPGKIPKQTIATTPRLPKRIKEIPWHLGMESPMVTGAGPHHYWTCCMCRDGPMPMKLAPYHLLCGHHRCEMCAIGNGLV